MQEDSKDLENKTRIDYEFKILEGQKMSDVFHEVGLPTNARGKRELTLKIEFEEGEVITKGEIETIERAVYSELEEWGFLDKDIEHDVIIHIDEGKEYSLTILTD